MSKRTCSVDGCDRPFYGKGWCNMHYQRWRKGSPVGGAEEIAFADPIKAFSARTQWNGDCLEWTGALYRNGYGQMNVNGRKDMPHRFAYRVANGEIPEGAEIDHICRNRKCCNIEHLRLTTPSQNNQNQARANRDNASGRRGVYRSSKGDRWFVQVKLNGQLFYGGTYASIEEADAAAIALRNRIFTHNNDDRAA